MKLVILGVGGWISKPILGHTSILVEVTGEKLLLDAGEGVSKALYLYGGGFQGLRGIVVTHLHGDHVLGLPTLLMLLKHGGNPRVKIYNPVESVAELKALLRITGVDYEEVAEIVGAEHASEHAVGPFKLRFTRAQHTIPSIAVRVESGEKCIAYSGDTAYSRDIVELSRNCSVLIHEASGHSPTAHVYGHSTVKDAVRVAVEAGVEKLVLVHYYLEVPYVVLGGDTKIPVYVAYPGFELDV